MESVTKLKIIFSSDITKFEGLVGKFLTAHARVHKTDYKVQGEVKYCFIEYREAKTNVAE